MIQVRREHQLKLLPSSSTSLPSSPATNMSTIVSQEGQSSRQDGDEEEGQEEGQNKKQRRTKFYSRFEQRAHRRKFASLDPTLQYTPLAWTNTLWSWKRTYFGDCRFIESKDVSTPNRIELDQALEDPSCTPLLLYPSHSAVDIHALVTNETSSSSSHTTTPSSRYHCQNCIHQSKDPSDTSTYPYKLIIALDGSWSHAKIMYRCNPRLQQLAQIKFPNPPQSIYHELKPEPKVTYTSTAEAVGQAVALLGWPTSGCGDTEGVATNADLLMEDLIRPLKRMIEIQDTIQETQDTETHPTESVMTE
ncbi:hypothetical protein BG003_011859 [Podila horticola]|nr:hypothetical protein BG003_011859 [Podila horticola]